MTLPGFMPCLDCEDGLEYPTPSFSESHPLPVPCPSCSGLGQVPHPDTVKAVASAMYRGDSKPWMAELAQGKARLALLAYAQTCEGERMSEPQIDELVQLVDDYNQRLGRMSITEQRRRYGGATSWSRIPPYQIERILSLMAEDGIRLSVGERDT